MSPNPPSKALRDMQISKSEKKILGPPLGTPLDDARFFKITIGSCKFMQPTTFTNKFVCTVFTDVLPDVAKN